MQSYLSENNKTKTSRTIYKIRSRTLDLKSLAQWKHSDNVCVMCEVKEETIKHFMTCDSYGETFEDWTSIYKNDPSKQVKIAEKTEKRLLMREMKMQEVGQDSSLPAPRTPN